MSMGSSPMFPTIVYNYSWSYVLNAINWASAHKKFYVEIRYTRKSFLFLNVLKKVNYVGNFYVFRKNNLIRIRIVPSYFKSQPIATKLRILSSPAQSYPVSLRSLYLLKKRSGCAIYLLSTSRGVITLNEALKFKVSGHMLGYFLL